MNYILFEDSKTYNLSPFTLNHASFEMRCGAYSNIERISNLLSNEDKLYLIAREEIQSLIREKYPLLVANPKIIPSGLFLNGATIWNKNLINSFEINKSYSSNGKLIAINRSVSTELIQFNDLLKDSMEITLDIKRPLKREVFYYYPAPSDHLSGTR